MLKLRGNWTVCLQRPKDGPSMSRCLEAEALPPPGFWSITNNWAERHIPTRLPPSPCAHGPGVSPARKGRKPECCPPSAASGPGPPGAPLTYVASENYVHRCHTHTEAGTRPSNLQVHQPPLGRGQGLFPQVHNQSFPVSANSLLEALSTHLQNSGAPVLQEPLLASPKFPAQTVPEENVLPFSCFLLDSGESRAFSALLQLRGAKIVSELIKMVHALGPMVSLWMEKHFKKT